MEEQWVHIPFPMVDLTTCEEKFGHLSEDPSRFAEEFTKLTMFWELTWGTDRSSFLLASPLKRKAGSLLQPGHMPVNWQPHIKDIQSTLQERMQPLTMTSTGATSKEVEGLHQEAHGDSPHRRDGRCVVKPVNYDEIREVTWKRWGSGPLTGPAFRKYTSINPDTHKG